jgi:transposase
MLKIVYPVCCGLDVHRSFIFACVASTDEKGITSYKQQRFSSFTKGLKELADWLMFNHCSDVCMESTGKYWIPVYNILEQSCKIVLAHPKYVKAIRGKKTDKKDAKWIADIFKHDLVSGSFIPPLDIRQLRDLMRYRTKLTNFNTGEKNRAQNCLTVSNIQLASVVSDVFGKSASAITEHLLNNPNDKDFDFKPLLPKSLKSKAEDIGLAIDGNITPEQAEKMKIILSHMKSISLCKSNLDSVILGIAEKYTPQIKLISTVPPIKNPLSAIAIISEIGVDMDVFKTAKHLCSWAGLTPQNNESAGKKKSVRISRAGAYLKPLSVQIANAAVKSNKHLEFKNRYQSIKKRRGHKRAIIAIARMLLTAIYQILNKNEPYNVELYKKSDAIPITRDVSVEQAIFILQRQGYQISKV